MNWTNAIAFQLTWLACVLGGTAWGSVGLAALGINAYSRAGIHGTLRADLILALTLGTLGWLLDSAWIRLGVLDFGTPAAPAWIALLWIAVALTVNHSLRFLHARPLLGGILAGCAAPLSYLTGERLGAVTVSDPFGLLAIAITWALVFGIAFALLSAYIGDRRESR